MEILLAVRIAASSGVSPKRLRPVRGRSLGTMSEACGASMSGGIQLGTEEPDEWAGTDEPYPTGTDDLIGGTISTCSG